MTQSAHLAPGEFYGQIIRRRVCSGATLSVVRHARARDLPVHTHEQSYFCLLIEGSYSERYESRVIDYDPFSIALHPAKFSHSDSIGDAGGTFFTIELADEWHARLEKYVDLSNVEVELAGGDVVWGATQLLREFLETDQPNELLIESLLYAMLSTFTHFPAETSVPSWLETAKMFLQSASADKYCMKEIAEVAGVHPVSLARGFRVHENQTVGDFVSRLRVTRACHLMADGARRMTDIAVDCCFADQSHFTRVFKRITGMTPTVFRKLVLRSRTG